VRPELAGIARKYGAALQVVEVPPGPPVQAPLVAEIYGPFYERQREVTRAVREIFASTPDIVDVDDSIEEASERIVISIDQQKAALLGVSQQQAVQALEAALGGFDATFLRSGRERYPVPVRLEMATGDKASVDPALELELLSSRGEHIPLSEIASSDAADGIIHKDLPPVTFVTGDMASSTARSTACSRSSAHCPTRCRPERSSSSGSSARRRIPTGSHSSGTASGRSPLRRSATWGSRTRSA
jgi:multidrug efflux pump subunit AcrB